MRRLRPRANRTMISSPRPDLEVPPHCYKCSDLSCVYSIIQCVFVIGIIADVIVIWRVIVDRKLRNETFVAIACLALCDSLFLSMNMASVLSRVVQFAFCVKGFQLSGTPLWPTFQGITWFAAQSHISLLSLVRFVILTYPLNFRRWVTSTRVLMFSGILWLSGCLIFGTAKIINARTGTVAGESLAYLLCLWGIVYGVPIIITVISHVAKVYNVRKTRSDNEAGLYSHETSNADRKMLIMILVVIILATVLPLPRLVRNILLAIDQESYISTNENFRGISYTLYLLNFAINPFVYAFLSVAFRDSLKSSCRRQRH